MDYFPTKLSFSDRTLNFITKNSSTLFFFLLPNFNPPNFLLKKIFYKTNFLKANVNGMRQTFFKNIEKCMSVVLTEAFFLLSDKCCDVANGTLLVCSIFPRKHMTKQ